MGRTRTALRTGVRWAQPLAQNVARSRTASRNVDEIVVLPMADHDGAVALATVFGARVGAPGPRDLAIAVAVPGDELRALATTVGDHRRRGGDVLVLLVGNAAERRMLERELRTDPDVGIAVMLLVDRLDGTDLVRIRRRVADMIISHREGARRSYAGVQEDVSHQLEHRLALRLAVRSILVADADATAAGFKTSHTKLVADRGAMADGGVDPRTIGLMVGLALLTPVWRRGAGRLAGFVPFTRIVARGTAAYAITRLVGLAAARLTHSARTAHQEER